MRALVVRELTGPAGMSVAEIDPPEAPPGAVRVAVRAAGLGLVDTLIARGRYQLRVEPPYVPGLEFSGTVEAALAGCGFVPGQEVVGHAWGGACGEIVYADPAMLAPLPRGLTHEQGAAFVVNYQTAWLTLVRRARLAAGERVLVHGAAGGLGLACVQVAAALGADVTAVGSTDERRRLALAAGAARAYGPEAWFDAVRAAGGADVIVDPVGGDVFEQSVRCLASEGRLLTVGFASGAIGKVAANRLLLRNAGVLGFAWRELILAVGPQLFAQTAAELERLVEGGLRPVLTDVRDLAGGPEAFAALESRSAVGKIVLTVRS
jgi:NADPH2:quinone reductase